MADNHEMDKQEFWIQMMGKLNNTVQICEPIPELLADLCRLFSFGCGFIYRADYTGVFKLEERFVAYPNDHLYNSLDLSRTLSEEELKQLAQTQVVSFSGRQKKDALAQKLSVLFNANSMILLPLVSHELELIALVGVVDRRSERTILPEDMQFAYATLATLANHIKLELYQKRVETTQKSLESVLDNMGVDIYVNDFYTNEILYVNRSMAEPYGGAENMIGKICWEVLYDDKPGPCEYCPRKKILDENGQPTSKIYSWDYQRPFDGSWFRVLSGALRWVDGRLAQVISSIDITENKKNEETIRQMAEYDSLTGLPNRMKLVNTYEEEIPRILAEGRMGYLLFFDLDGFKMINDEIGHRAGDEMLINIGIFLENNPQTKGKSFRYGGDEFIVLLDEPGQGTIEELIALLQNRFSKEWELSEDSVQCNCSIGVSEIPQDGTLITELINKADAAMYASKRAGKGRASFYGGGACQEAESYLKKSNGMTEIPPTSSVG